MKQSLLAFMLIPALLSAQDTSNCLDQPGIQYDHDGDLNIGMSDVLQLLTWFGTSFDDDQDGIMDCEDDCIGEYDECGVCNGPGPQLLTIDTVITVYDSIYVDAIDDWVLYEHSLDTIFSLVCDAVFEECGDLVSMDGYNYSTVQIGDQCWFAENLRTSAYRNGDVIPSDLSNSQWTSAASGATAVQGQAGSNCTNLAPDIDACDPEQALEAYGRIYNWYAVSDTRGLCPVGWHVSTESDWQELETHLGMSSAQANSNFWRGTDQGQQLKAVSGWNNDGNGDDLHGFMARPGGSRSGDNGGFGGNGGAAVFWTSTTTGSYRWYRVLNSDEERIYRGYLNSRYGMSIRCLLDTE